MQNIGNINKIIAIHKKMIRTETWLVIHVWTCGVTDMYSAGVGTVNIKVYYALHVNASTDVVVRGVTHNYKKGF